MSKYKYYFKKPKSEIVKDIFSLLVTTGIIFVAASSPYFILNFQKKFKQWRKYKRTRISNVFWRLQKEGCIKIRKENHQIYISLTEKGRKKANWLQIDSLKIKKPKKWDGKWRLVIFDISQLKKNYREMFRGKLKELGFLPLQKSVWVHPFDCKDEINLLKDFLGLTEQEIRLIIAEKIGNDEQFRKAFKL